MVKLFAASYGIELLPLEDRVAMVRHAYDSGIRYFDTAHVYGESEQIMGRGLKGVRDNVYLATKCHMTDPAKCANAWKLHSSSSIRITSTACKSTVPRSSVSASKEP